MIIELQNFGPIKSFKFDTSKDMHAIFGKNNIGKSYAISAVYLILKGLKNISNNLFMRLELLNYSSDNFQKNITKIEEGYNSNVSVDISSDIEGILKDVMDLIFVQQLQTSFYNTYMFENISNTFSNIPLKIIIQFDNIIIWLTITDDNKIIQISDLEIKYDDQGFYVDVVSSDEKLYSVRYHSNSFGYTKKPNIENNSEFVLKQIVNHLTKDVISKISSEISEHIYYLPASRSGLYNSLNSFGAIFSEISRNRYLLSSKFEIPNLSEPISDYFLNLNTIDKAQANQHYLTHFEEIERNILKGKITLDNETKKYYYVPTDTHMRLELSFTSSMISEIAPIIAHLKYIIPLESDKPSILFIEEPEAHLHPEIQILLIEYFVKLSKGKVKIVMTSHSNYIFNKLSNLLISNKIDKDKLSVSLMKMTPEGSVIEEGAMQIDEYGIEDNNFVDVAEQLYEERMSLLEKL